MNKMKPLTIASLALCSALSLNTPAHAQLDGMGEAQAAKAQILANVQGLHEKCKNGSISYADYKKGNLENSGAMDFIRRDMNQQQRDRYDRDFPTFTECPPVSDKIKASAGEGGFMRSYNAKIRALYSTAALPQAGYGVEIVPGAEKFVTKTDSSLTGYKLEAHMIPKDKRWMFGIAYTEVDGSSEGQIANGTENVGIVYHDFAPSGSTGVAIGPRGLDVRTLTEHHELEIEAFFKDLWSWATWFDVGAGIRLSETLHTAEITTPSFTDIRSDSEQRVYEHDFYLKGVTTLDFELGSKPTDVTLSIIPGVEAGYRDANLESRQHNMCGLCGAAERDFTINIDDDDGGLYVGANIEAKLGVKISETARLGIGGQAWWRSNTAEIINTETGDDLFIRNMPTHLDTDEAYGASLGAWFSAEF